MRLRTDHALGYLHKLNLQFLSYSRNSIPKEPEISSTQFNVPPPPVHVLNKIEASQSYFLEIQFNMTYGPDPCKLHTFHAPNLMYNPLSLHRSKGTVQVRSFVKCLVTQ
jgi:hypothetical protein